MAFTDLLVLRYLLQATESAMNPVEWREQEDSGFLAEINEVRVELREVHSKSGGRLFLTLSHHGGQVHIAEPISTTFFGRGYKDAKDQETADSLQLLARLIARQCAYRRRKADEHVEECRQAIYRRLVFGLE
jgi:hypothetical protein